MPARRPAADAALIQIVDAALADATRRAGDWLACGLGCTQCCHGVFAISALDAARLQEGLALLRQSDPLRAARVQARAATAREELAADFPGDPLTGLLGETAEQQERFAAFANDAPCPVLDPDTGQCDLYATRPMTCRIFGPPVLGEDGWGMCELCYVGAPEDAVLAGAMQMNHGALEEALNAEVEQTAGCQGSTIIAFALR